MILSYLRWLIVHNGWLTRLATPRCRHTTNCLNIRCKVQGTRCNSLTNVAWQVTWSHCIYTYVCMSPVASFQWSSVPHLRESFAVVETPEASSYLRTDTENEQEDWKSRGKYHGLLNIAWVIIWVLFHMCLWYFKHGHTPNFDPMYNARLWVLFLFQDSTVYSLWS